MSNIELTPEQKKEAINKYDMLLDKSNPDRKYLNEILNLYYFTVFLYNTKLGKSIKKDQQIINNFLKKASETTYSIYFLLSNNLDTDAAILLRTLMELAINVKLIFQEDPEKRLELFQNLFYVQKYLNLTEKEIELPESEKESMKKLYELYKDNYKSIDPNHWAYSIFKEELSGREASFYHICKSFGDDFQQHDLKMYKHVYKLLSLAVHSSSGMHNLKDETENFCSFTSAYCIQIYSIISEYLKIEDSGSVEYYLYRFYNVFQPENRKI